MISKGVVVEFKMFHKNRPGGKSKSSRRTKGDLFAHGIEARCFSACIRHRNPPGLLGVVTPQRRINAIWNQRRAWLQGNHQLARRIRQKGAGFGQVGRDRITDYRWIIDRTATANQFPNLTGRFIHRATICLHATNQQFALVIKAEARQTAIATCVIRGIIREIKEQFDGRRE